MLTSSIILFLPNYVFLRSTLSKSPKKNESVRKKISVKEDKVLLASLDDTLDTMIGFNSESLVHSSTLTSSTGVEGLDNIQTSAIKPKVSFHYILLIVFAHLNHETVVSMYCIIDMVEFCHFSKKSLSKVSGRTKLHKKGSINILFYLRKLSRF